MIPSKLPVSRAGARLRRAAFAAFAAALVARVAWIAGGDNNFNFVDLRVYHEASRRVFDGTLYDFALTNYTPDQPLPFTYPPFAALVFAPLRFVPFPVLAIGWVLLTAGLLFLVTRMSLAILAAARGAPTRMSDIPVQYPLLWTAGAMWLDPVRTNLDYGQVNVVIMALGVWAAYLLSRHQLAPTWKPNRGDATSGALIGLAAGIKLTPAIGGLFLLARGRPLAALYSAVTFAATVAVSYLILPTETRRYFTDLIGDTSPIGDPTKPINQSLRGTVSRFSGSDIGAGFAWLVGVFVAFLLLACAWWVVRRGDALISLILVQLLGLLASPISWIHHAVWIVPLLIWLVHGPLGRFGGDAFAVAAPHYTRWTTVLAAVIVGLASVGVSLADAGLRRVGIEGGPLWALVSAPVAVAAAGLVAVILTHRTQLRRANAHRTLSQ